MLAVDLEGIQGLVAARVAGRFKAGQRAVVEAAHEGAGVVDAHLLDLARQVVLALLHERFGHGVNRGQRPVEPQGGVDAVSEQIAGDAAAGGGHVQTPQASASLGQLGLIVQSCKNLAR